MVHPLGIEAGIRKITNTNLAAHYPTNPAHGTVTLLHLIGELEAIRDRKDTDAMMQSIALQDAMPRITGLLIDLHRWSKAVADMGPDQVPENGADSCL